jgi:SAM-dependent methyltransferase
MHEETMMSTATEGTQEVEAAVATLKAGHRATWAAGDYAAVAELIDEVPPAHVMRAAAVRAGEDVLDVATGTGNLALRAATAHARVVGLDLTPELFATARARAEAWGVDVEWVEGDAEALPYEDASFDVVTSVFGIQFAPRHGRVAAELARVTRPGGRVVLCNWTPEGKVGELFSILSRYLPKPPAFASPPPRWGDEAHVRSLFADVGPGLTAETERATTPWRLASAEHYTAFMETNYGPLVKARERLTAEGTWDACRAEIVEMVERRNLATDGTLHVEAEYLVAVIRKP